MTTRVLLCLAAVSMGTSMSEGAEFAIEQLYPAKMLHAVEIREEDAYHQATGRRCDFDAGDRGSLTYCSPAVKDLNVDGGVLAFRMGESRALLSWGNYRDAQPRGDRAELWDAGTVELRVRQSVADESTWSIELFRGARRSRRHPKPQRLEGGDWQTLTFPYFRDKQVADCFALTVAGTPGSRIELDSLRVLRFAHRAHFRKTFDLPTGKVWRAVCNAGPVNIWVNGKRVPFRKPWLWHTSPVELTRFLRPGKNVISLYGERIAPERGRGYDPFTYLQGQAIMASGDTVSLSTDATWRGGADPAPNWTESGFDDRDWKRPKVRGASHYYMGNTYPAYEGRLVFRNPKGKRLFYNEGEAVQIQVHIPAGLVARSPAIGWALHSVTEDEEREIATGRLAQCRSVGDSLVYDVLLGRRTRGVYSFAATLEIDAETVEEHQAEPVVVTGHIPMKEVPGDTYEQGMRLALEDTIDFTDPGDRHVWIESEAAPKGKPAPKVTTPRIVRKGSLIYRETGADRGAMFSYQFRFQRPRSLYLFVLEYPDDADRGLAVNVCTASENVYTGSRAAPGVITGGKFPLTGKMRELRWICAGNPGVNTLDIVSAMAKKRAAATRVRIYRIEELPALKVNGSGQRWLGLHTERGWVYVTTFGGHLRAPRSHHPLRPEGISERQWLVREFAHWFGASERYAQYLRFTGQNLHVMGVYQYSMENTPYTPPASIRSARLIRDFRDLFVRIAEHNDIRILAGIEFQRPTRTGSANFMDPEVEQSLLRVIDDLVEKFGESPVFMGVNFMLYPGWGNPAFGWPVEQDYGDTVAAAFENDTGTRLPVDANDPDRFRKRQAFLGSDQMRATWVSWKCRKVRELLLRVRDRMRVKREDLQCLAMHYHDMRHLSEWAKSGRPYGGRIREAGFDPSLFRNDDGLWFGRYLHTGQMRRYALEDKELCAVGWEQNVGREAIDFYDQPRNRAIMILQHFDELAYRLPGLPWQTSYRGVESETKWPWLGSLGPFYHQHQGHWAMEPYTQGAIGADPNLVMFGWCDSTALVSNEQPLREFARAFLSLPGEKFCPVLGTGLDTNLAIRELRQGRKYCFYVANPGYWPVTGQVTLTAAARVLDLRTREQVEAERGDGRIRVAVRLEPYGMAAYSADGAQAKVESWTTEPVAKRYLAHIRTLVDRAANSMERPEVRKILSEEDLVFARKTASRAAADLDTGQAARAWSAVTNWRFWSLLHDSMLKAGSKRAWWVIGPFRNDREEGVEHRRVLPVEREVLVSHRATTEKAYDGVGEGGKVVPVRWKKTISVTRGTEPNFVDLDSTFAANEWVLAYAFSCVHSPKARQATLSVGSDDGIRVWLNGELVIDHYEARGAAPNQNQTPVQLRKGWNAVLVKVEERIGGWGFFLDFLDAMGEPLSDIEYSSDVDVQATYSYRTEGITIQDITWGDERVFRTRYHYLSGQCGDGRRVSAYFSSEKPKTKFSFTPVRGEAGKLALTWEGTPQQGIDYRQQVRLLPRRIVWTMEYGAQEKLLHPHAPFFRFELGSTSPLLWGCPVRLIRKQREKLLRPPDPDHQKPLSIHERGLESIEFQTKRGPLRLDLQSEDRELTSRRLDGRMAPGTNAKPAQYHWSVSVWTGERRKPTSAGYHNVARLSLTFGEGR